MQLLCLLTIIAVMGAADLAPPAFLPSPLARAGLAVALMAWVVLLAFIVGLRTRRALDRAIFPSEMLLERYDRSRRRHVAAGLLTAVGIVYLLDWHRLVPAWTRAPEWLLLDDILLLLPVFVPLILSWAIFHGVDRDILERRGMLYGDLPLRISLGGYLLERIGRPLGIVLLPLALFRLTADLVRLVFPAQGETVQVALSVLLSIALIACTLPAFLVRCWRTTPLDARSSSAELAAVAAVAGVGTVSVRRWDAESGAANAVLVGMIPGQRFVLLSRALLQCLTAWESAGVYAHELAHLKHRHYIWRGLAVVLPLAILTVAETLWPAPFAAIGSGLALSAEGVQGLCLTIALAIHFPTLLAAVSRRLELQADLTACRLLAAAMPALPSEVVGSKDVDPKDVAPVPTLPPDTLDPRAVETFASALAKVAHRNEIDPAATDWQHPSVIRRIGLLRAWSTDAAALRRFERGVLLLQAGLAIFSLLALVALLGPRS